jgi:hypothetical protein
MHEHELLRLLREIDRKLDIIMTTPQTPQQVIDQASAALQASAASLTSVAAALPALLAAAGGTPVDTTALVAQVTAVINASNAIVALLPAGSVPPPSGSGA